MLPHMSTGVLIHPPHSNSAPCLTGNKTAAMYLWETQPTPSPRAVICTHSQEISPVPKTTTHPRTNVPTGQQELAQSPVTPTPLKPLGGGTCSPHLPTLPLAETEGSTSGLHRVGGVPWWPLRKREELRGCPREEPESLLSGEPGEGGVSGAVLSLAGGWSWGLRKLGQSSRSPNFRVGESLLVGIPTL